MYLNSNPVMRKRTSLILLPLLLLLLSPTRAEAQVAIGPHFGTNLDSPLGAELFVGATSHISVPALPVILNPAVDFYIDADDFTLLQFDANALLTFGVDNVLFSPYAGGGLAVSYLSTDEAFGDDGDLGFDPDVSATDLGINAVAGTFFNLASLRPFAEARITIGDIMGGTSVSVKGGLMFNF